MRKAGKNVFGESADHRLPRPIGHAVDPDHQPAGRQPTEVVVALEQNDIRADARRTDGGRRPRGAAADHENIALRMHWNVACALAYYTQVAARAARCIVDRKDFGNEKAFVRCD